MVSAASSGRSSPPGAVKLADAPVFDRVVFNGVGCQSAHLDTRVVTQELIEGHPAEIGQSSHSAATNTNITTTFIYHC